MVSHKIPIQPPPSSKVAAFVTREHHLVIGGRRQAAAGGRTLPVFDPATGKEIARIPDAGQADVDAAVAAARAAFDAGPWPRMRPAEREAILHRLANLLEAHAAEFAELESLDNGKCLTTAAAADVPLAIGFFRYMAGWPTKIEGSTVDVSIPIPDVQFHAFCRKEPVGVVGQIIPWNFPLLMASWKLAPVLATGCTAILKPAEQTSMTALRLAELVEEAGVPNGVINIITGRGEEAGAMLVRHPGVDKIAFTGSTPVGKSIGRACMDTMKRVSLELGGKSPVIVLPDADVEAAVAGASQAIFFNHGQTCCAGSRLYVHRKIYDQVLEGVSNSAAAIRLGPGLDPSSEMGPLVSEAQRDRVTAYIAAGRRDGASVVAGGEPLDGPGYYVPPTVLADVNRDMSVVREEIFGPVLVVQRIDDVDDLAQLANDSEYGLAASIWSNDLKAVHRLAPKIRAGTVWVNCHNLLDASLPFGGYKQSGLGREMGKAVLDLYTEQKSVCMMV